MHTPKFNFRVFSPRTPNTPLTGDSDSDTSSEHSSLRPAPLNFFRKKQKSLVAKIVDLVHFTWHAEKPVSSAVEVDQADLLPGGQTSTKENKVSLLDDIVSNWSVSSSGSSDNVSDYESVVSPLKWQAQKPDTLNVNMWHVLDDYAEWMYQVIEHIEESKELAGLSDAEYGQALVLWRRIDRFSRRRGYLDHGDMLRAQTTVTDTDKAIMWSFMDQVDMWLHRLGMLWYAQTSLADKQDDATSFTSDRSVDSVLRADRHLDAMIAELSHCFES